MEKGRTEHDFFSVPSPQRQKNISTHSLIDYKEFSVSDVVQVRYILFLFSSWRSTCNPTDSMHSGKVTES